MISSAVLSIFKKISKVIWPIEKEEVKLFLPLSLMMLCLLFNFGALRSVKDALVVPTIGAEVISFLKLWLVLPFSILFTLLYLKLSNKFDFGQVFYIVILVFLTVFIVFTFVIYPHQNYWHPSPCLITNLSISYPNCQWFIKILGKWSYAIMYIFSELWSVVVINLMFWQFANHIFDTEKARRFYPILGMIGNIGLIIAGNVLVFFSSIAITSEQGVKAPDVLMLSLQVERMLKPIVIIIVIAGLLAMVLFRITSRVTTSSIILAPTSSYQATAGIKTKLSIKESVKLIVKSRYVGHIVLLILCYGLIINILEGPWKAKVSELYPSTGDYLNFMGHFNIWMGVSCVTFMVIGSNILRNFSWLISALLTPIMIAVTGLIFFTFVIFADDLSVSNKFNPLYVAVLIGALQNILSKATKYSLFDSTKEMAYIPLPLELKIKGKAAVEIIGTKFGKSLGAFIQSTMFIFLPQATFDSIASYLLVIFLLVIMLWLWNILKLNQEYLKFFKA